MLRGVPAATPQRKRRSQVATFPAAVGGWISNRALALPRGPDQPQGATRLDNFFPTATGTILRRGHRAYAQISDDGSPVRSLFSYVVGNNTRLFAATDNTIFDITNVSYSTNIMLSMDDYDTLIIDDDGNTLGENSSDGLDVFTGTDGGEWVTVQFGTTGNTYLIGVNGQSVGFIFDGERFFPYTAGGVFRLAYDAGTSAFNAGETLTGTTSGAKATIYKVEAGVSPGIGVLWLIDVLNGPFQNNENITDSGGGSATADGASAEAIPGITFPAPYNLTTSDFSFVWSYKSQLFFIEKTSLRAWYLAIDSIGGQLKPLPLNGELDKGGSLLWGQSWSLSSSGQGGLSDQVVFTTTEGQTAVYQGLSPDDADWSRVGVYNIGKPLGKYGFMRAGGDIVVATDVGYIALSKAVQVDYAALTPTAISYPIEVAWSDAITRRGRDWRCAIWPEGQMAIVIPTVSDAISPVWFVANASTGAWASFTQMYATCVLAWNGRLFFGSRGGLIHEAMVGGTDDGDAFTGVYVPLFSDVGIPTSMKAARMARVETRSGSPVSEKVSCLFDFDTDIPSAPEPQPVPVGNEWENAAWDQSMWNVEQGAIVINRRHSVAGNGYRLAPCYQVTSGATVPLDVELVSLDITFETGDVFT